MHTSRVAANPFGLMMNPQAILAAVERSERLGGLQRRVCRPLDKPLIPRVGAAAALAEVDAHEDAEDDVPDDFGADSPLL